MSKNIHYLAGVERYKAGNYSIAIECFLLAIESEPGVADHHEQAGISFFHSGNKEQALFHYSKAQLLDPRNPFRYASRAFILDSMGDTEAAIADYRIAIELDPDDAIAHNNLGLLEEKLGYKKQSEARFKRADQLAEEHGFGPANEIKAAHEKAVDSDRASQHIEDVAPIEFSPKPLNGHAKTAKPEATAPTVKQADPAEPTKPANFWQIIASVFSSSTARADFWAFVKNGFRVK